MVDRYRVGKPSEGLETLVARFSFTHFDRAVEKIRKLRSEGVSEDRIAGHVQDSFRHADKITRKNIHQLALGLTPKDDLSDEDVSEQVEVKEGTLRLNLVEIREDVEAGAVVFFEGRRWVVASSQGATLVLKHF